MVVVAARRLSFRRARPQLRKLSESRLVRPVRPVAANLASIPMHVAGIGCIDFAAFHLPDPHFWGWLVTGVSLMWLEHVIADEP